MKAKLTNLVRVAIERAEALKGIKTVNDDSVMKSLAKLPSVPETNFPDTNDKPVESEQPVNTSSPSTPTAPSGKYIGESEMGRIRQSTILHIYYFNKLQPEIPNLHFIEEAVLTSKSLVVALIILKKKKECCFIART